MADNDRISYDNNEQKLYLGTMDTTISYAVEENALITEEQLNRTEKDIRDYLDGNVTNQLNNYVAYFPQEKSDLDRLNALNNVFPSNYWPDFKDHIISILRDINSNSNNNSDYYNIYDYALSKGATIYYLQGSACKGDYGVAIIPEYFRDIDESEIFYQNGTLANYTRVLNAVPDAGVTGDTITVENENYIQYNLSDILNNNTLKSLLNTITTNNVYQRNGLRFASLVKTLENQGSNPTGGLISFYENNNNIIFDNNSPTESVALQLLTQYYPYDYRKFLPTLLQNIKEGDILYNSDTNKAYVVTTDQILGSRKDELCIKTWQYERNTLYDCEISENTGNTLKIFNSANDDLTNTFQNKLIKDNTSNGYASKFLENFTFTTQPTSDNPVNVTPMPENQLFYITGSLSVESQPGVDLVHYPYGAFAIPCEELTGYITTTNIWIYNGKSFLGGGYEGITSDNFILFCSLNGNNNTLVTPKAGDYVYNPYSKEVMRIARNKSISERCILGENQETYLLEPIPHLIIGEYDGIPRSNGTYLRGSGEFKMADYKINTNLFNIFKNRFEDYIQDNQLIIDNNFASVILNNEFTPLLSINNITTTPSYSWAEEPTEEDQDEIEKLVENKTNLYLNTYFILPYYIQSNENGGNLGELLTAETRTLQLHCVNPGDIISFKGISFEVIDRPRLLPITNKRTFVQGLVDSHHPAEKFLEAIWDYFNNQPNNILIANTTTNTIKFKTTAETDTYVSFPEWLQYFGITDSTLLAYADKVDNSFTDLDYYLRILYYRLLTNVDRPIFVKVTPINYTVTGKGDKGDPGTNGRDGQDGSTLDISITPITGLQEGTKISFSYGIPNTDQIVKTVSLYNGSNGENGPAGQNGTGYYIIYGTLSDNNYTYTHDGGDILTEINNNTFSNQIPVLLLNNKVYQYSGIIEENNQQYYTFYNNYIVKNISNNKTTYSYMMKEIQIYNNNTASTNNNSKLETTIKTYVINNNITLSQLY